ncbi:MAG: hypothetical protein LBL62_11340, partial [Planctomycetaceae bacterium]|nr:hypothetical protein [Planctomycetaceae bacterium]
MIYTKAVLKFAKLNTVAQQREAVTRGRSLLPYRLRYRCCLFENMLFFFILFLLTCCITFFQSDDLSAQILLDTSPGLIQQDHT